MYSGVPKAGAPDFISTFDVKVPIATGQPAYAPWVLNDKPESGEGFEAAVAYAVAAKLGFAKADVVWVRTSFDQAIAPGPKNFDFNLQQFSITDERKKNVDFSSAYYSTTQTVVTVAGTKAADATSIADLKSALLGAQVGTTSYSAISDVIKPAKKGLAFNTNDDAVAALKTIVCGLCEHRHQKRLARLSTPPPLGC